MNLRAVLLQPVHAFDLGLRVDQCELAPLDLFHELQTSLLEAIEVGEQLQVVATVGQQ